MRTVGFALIVRDAADTLEVCLKSIESLWDQLVVVDTGSIDETPDVAQRFGAEVHHFEWCNDFAKARNFSFDLLKTDMAFWIDADDLLVGREYFDEMIRKCVDKALDGAVLEYFYAFDHVGQKMLEAMEPGILGRQIAGDVVVAQLAPRCITTQWRERLVKNDPSWRWAYPVHEALPVAGRRLGKYEKVKIIHRKHVRKNPVDPERNIAILLNVPLEHRDERIWFYFGMEYAQKGDFDKSIDAFERYLPLSTVEDERYFAQHFLGDLYSAKGEHQRSIECNLRAVGLRPTWRDAYAGLVSAYIHLQDYQKVVYYGAMAKKAEIPDTPFAYNPMHEATGWVGDYVKGLVECGLAKEALAEIAQARDCVPEDVVFQHNEDVLSSVLNFESGKRSIADAVEFFLRLDDAETAAVILSRLPEGLRDHPDIRRWIDMTGSICGSASRGEICQDQLKRAPGVEVPGDTDSIVWTDLRAEYLRDFFSNCPEVKRVLQVGGPVGARAIYETLGIQAARVEHVDHVEGDWDAVLLWGCLERVKYPDRLVERARAAITPGGYLVAFVPNGPSRKGLAPPQQESVRLRAYSIDTFRQVMGTVQMPKVLPGWQAEAGDLVLTVPMPLPRGRSRSIAIVCPNPVEIWGPFSLLSGIGGSEEAVIRLSRAFARRGHKVTVYGSGYIGEDLPLELGEPYGKVWYESIVNYQPANILIGWRYPEVFLNQIRPLTAEWRALWLHDSADASRVERAIPFVDCVWAISDYHASLYNGLDKIYAGRNGIDPWEFDNLEWDEKLRSRVPIPRNPSKMIWASTPFRGLHALLERFWLEIKRRVPEAELHVFYGWNSADRMGVTSTDEGRRFKEQVTQLVETLPGVVWRGRVGQTELYQEFLSAGVFPYSATWKEENCINAYIAQASGAWPVVFPVGALPQSVVFGWKVEEPKFVDSVVEAVRTTEGRDRMMQWARTHLSWDDVAASWERLWKGRLA